MQILLQGSPCCLVVVVVGGQGSDAYLDTTWQGLATVVEAVPIELGHVVSVPTCHTYKRPDCMAQVNHS